MEKIEQWVLKSLLPGLIRFQRQAKLTFIGAVEAGYGEIQ
jgi:hypothetical protein